MAEGSNSNGYHIEDDSEMLVYKKSALSVTTFKIVYNHDDLGGSKKTLHFNPFMAHQVFGENESIFGYRSLSITIYYLHSSSRCYVDVQKSGKLKSNTLKVDDIMQSLDSWLPTGYTTELKQFEEAVKNEKHDVMFGEVLMDFKDKLECKLFPYKNVHSNYKISLCDVNDAEFQEYHKRFETFIVWFIDGASYIDLSDERWMLFYVYEEFMHPEKKEIYRTPIGYCSVYKFLAYPDKVRARISQFFIMPSHHRRGIGSKLYNVVVDKLRSLPEVIDITVEEPTNVFQKIRDFSDCQKVMQELKDNDIDLVATDIKKIFSHMKKFKIGKKQCQRLYDILRCYHASRMSIMEYSKYVRNIRKRISADIEKEYRGSKRVCNLNWTAIPVERLADRESLVESEFKDYMDSIEPSVKSMQQNLAGSR
ncbi:hypothetical protein NQ317_001405 [Molorchus minor]|uniref:histone acetyltransferase n=1 Tax=Molorchus minor TaxID=1323400 RepID=A0ABQ9J5H9_9CUCU|nr:hypothetical protein NQ317_001405 [Molorchus minor]